MNLLIHIGELEKWKTAIGNAKNAKKVKPNCKIEIVANGSAPIILKEAVTKNFNLIDEFKGLKELGVEVKVCNNSLIKFDIDKKDLIKEAIVVKAAVIEILECQEKGYAYLKV